METQTERTQGKIARRFPIPTGYLFTGDYSKGQLETLSIGDYGKSKNAKADFLGYPKEIEGVPNTYCMLLSEKWVVTVSTQYGCPMKCTFCDVPNVKFRGNASFEDFARIADRLPEPISRKYCLNFAYSTDFEIDAGKVASLFDRDKFMAKITPIHNNNACRENGIVTLGGYDSWKPYQKPEEDLKKAGFDVLVFVPSIDEEDGLVTCGNAVLGGSTLKTTEDIIKIEGIKR